MSNKKKQLTVMGTVWDFWSVLKMFDKLYESKYISFYEPWLKGEIDKEKIILFNEKSKNPLLWPFKILKRTYKILKIIREFKPDLVITHHDDANVSIIPVILLNKIFKISNNTKFILWVRNNPIESYKEGLYSKIIILAYKYFYKYADIIIVQTQENKKIIESHFKSLKNKTKIVPNVYEIDKLQQLSNEPLEKQYRNIFKDSFVFINIGRLTEQKGQWFLIRSFKRVTEKYPNAKLIILGDGELKNKLQELINKLNLQNNVYLLGMQKNPFKFLKHSNCFVFSSLWEGLPNTVIEALSLNLPVISTDCKTGPREILCPELNISDKIDYPYYGKYGILTKPFSREFIWQDLNEKPLIEEEKMLADLMIKMIEDEDLRKRYSNGLERAKDFDIEKIIKEWKLLIEGTI
ncbi:capsular polysaccharide biosynthsis protein M [Methanocaldococcus jannaschii DSM 2661]|uniref:Uncharacterized glycosyltransferase MJ1059 n=1 Tax=Methanocaldococcus jannaschii (strain ATCC 43067 / DSM 2661 / JAL-1 / JCM 10045 / NBRC 100440) TaxID=243232 RepID=Y1059_METJA|nr:glycosyltransferase [Methanocaldococcus jannaschii]Q58459.1 RecName: Full=Uncharacterized glycosyltransferase MJ1059 [Methanocaldococcus jannaschii DSM 2661]AAB99063.1 capsular polysaccharide biosynthsis protein M [Methanocaldococcus jannaschii DSM 2661]